MQQVRTIYAHYDQMAQLLASGEIWVADTDDGGYRQAKAKGLTIEVAYPEEGLTAWYDGPAWSPRRRIRKRPMPSSTT